MYFFALRGFAAAFLNFCSSFFPLNTETKNELCHALNNYSNAKILQQISGKKKDKVFGTPLNISTHLMVILLSISKVPQEYQY